MTIDIIEWEEILFFARNHDWFQEGDEIEWNIFNNNGSRNSLILSPNVNGTIRGDILAKLSVIPNKLLNNKLNLYWEPGFKANVKCMDCFDNIVKWSMISIDVGWKNCKYLDIKKPYNYTYTAFLLTVFFNTCTLY